ncbi:MAG: tetratricopeptide repeat protein [Candidatus Doudnabacteria bacterium]|nr:tetratricopeptide repeat protein [Candidatus Doudnabacteria bacterium]
MSAYILPNSILLLAIVSVILLIARHFPEATRQLEESGPANKESARDVIKRWLQKARGGMRSFWRFVLEGKGLRDPKGSKFRMRQLLEQNRESKMKSSTKARITSPRNVQPGVVSVVSAPIESVDSPSAAEVATATVVVTEVPQNHTKSSKNATASGDAAVSKPPKSHSRRKAAAMPVNSDEIMRQAKAFIDAKEFLQARHELEQVVGSFQENPVFWARLGYVQYHLGAYMEAIRCYQKSLALDSNQANRYYNLALAHEAAQEHTESLAALDQALALDPSNLKYKQTRDALKTI